MKHDTDMNAVEKARTFTRDKPVFLVLKSVAIVALGLALSVVANIAPAQAEKIGLVNGKLPILADGFPAGPITLWCAQKQGHPDDVYNTIAMDIAAKYSPVAITKKCRASAPTYSYTLIDFIKQQPRGADGGYHPIWVTFYGTYIKPYMVKSLCNTPLNKIEPILSLVAAPYLFVVPEDSKIKTIEEAIAHLKAKPRTNIAASKPGTGTNAVMSLLVEAAGLDVNFVPTKGTGETKSVLLGGGVELATLVFGPGITDGLRVLAVSGDARSPALPDVPTLMERGYDIPGGSYWGYVVDKDTPQAHRDWLVSLFTHVAKDPKWQELNPHVMHVVDNAEAASKKVEAYMDKVLPFFHDGGLTQCPYANEPVVILKGK